MRQRVTIGGVAILVIGGLFGLRHWQTERNFKTLFQDPHYNVMDGLDTYIDDYSKPDPLPEGWLEKMNQVARLPCSARIIVRPRSESRS